MSFNQSQLDALDGAIAEGTLRVKYQDKEITYRSLDEMLRIRGLMASQIAAALGNVGTGNTQIGVYRSGL